MFLQPQVHEYPMLPENATTEGHVLTPHPVLNMDMHAELRQTVQAAVAKRQTKQSQTVINPTFSTECITNPSPTVGRVQKERRHFE